MNRRDFLASAAVAGLALASAGRLDAADAKPSNQLVELRVYHFASAEKQQAFAEFLAKSAVPAFNRAGVTPVGIFKATKEDNGNFTGDFNDLYVLLAHGSFESYADLPNKLAADQQYNAAAQDILDAPRKAPAYTSVDTSLILSWDSVAKVEVPFKDDTRVFQLRIYQAHNDAKAIRKSEMFVAGGEMDIFRSVGMPPVFGGRALAGSLMPNVTYMLAHKTPDGLKTGWSAFGGSPAWKKLRADETYKDTDPIKIVNIVLRPVAGSQI